MAKLKQEVLEKIKTDPDLFALVAKGLNIKPASLPMTVDRNGANLNQYSIVKLVADYLHKEPEEVLDEETVNNIQG
jgi:hypothetical protein